MKKLTITITAILIFVSCNLSKKENRETIELNNKAIAFLQYGEITPEKVDSAIYLLDKATEIDKDYSLGYINKMMFLFMKRDYPRLFETNKEIQRLKPNQPMWIIQEGLLYELSSDSVLANNLYKKGLSVYDSIFQNKDSISFDFKLEYINSLIIAKKQQEAKLKFEQLKQEYPNNQILKIYELKSKRELIKEITTIK